MVDQNKDTLFYNFFDIPRIQKFEMYNDAFLSRTKFFEKIQIKNSCQFVSTGIGSVAKISQGTKKCNNIRTSSI